MAAPEGEDPKPERALTPIEVGQSGLVVRDHGELYRIATQVASAKLCPEALRNSPGDVLIVMAGGMAMGWDPFISVQNGFVHRGRLGWPSELIISNIESRDAIYDSIKRFLGKGR